ncbi:MAG: FeS cluster assembly protein SufD [Chromatiales bacterium USCg_Taylor]|nr:MAG: FeS cluster assembly protein SufD [Chromatiales bacterium USCg_Taylor]
MAAAERAGMTGTMASHYAEEFARAEGGLVGADSGWFKAARRRALTHFGRIGFPTPKEEEWKYTSVAPIESRSFRLAGHPRNGLDVAELDRLRLIEAHELVFVNGYYSAQLSRLASLPAAVSVAPLSEALPDSLQEHMERQAEQPGNGFAALNAALLSDGVHIRVGSGVTLKTTLHLLFISTAPDGPTASFPRVFIEAGANSRVLIIEHYAGLTPEEYFTDALTEINVGPGATVEHYKWQMEGARGYHIGQMLVHQQRESRVTSYSVSLGAALARDDIAVSLAGEGAGASLNGLYMAKGRQHVDHHTSIDHQQPHTTSAEYYKGVLAGHARGVFDGKVVVREGAQKADAELTNKNLLLSEHAEMDTKPELQIYADDVKCSHGATVGQLDEDALFYLRSRGIEYSQATALLTYAFADDVVARIAIEPMRHAIERHLTAYLPRAALDMELL